MKTFLFFTAFFALNFSMALEIKAQLKDKAQDFVFKKANTILIDTNLSLKEVADYLIENGYMIESFNNDMEMIETEKFDIYKGWGTTSGIMKIWKSHNEILITAYAINNMMNNPINIRMEMNPNVNINTKAKLFQKINEFAMKMGKAYGVKVLYLKL